MNLGVHFDNFGSLYASVPGLLISLGMYVELGKKILEITLVLDGQKASFEVLSGGQILVALYLAWFLSASSAS